MSGRDRLALLGGTASVQIPPPHFRWPIIGNEEKEAVLHQLANAQLSLPRRSGVVDELETKFAGLLGMPYVMSTNSGTAALHAAYFGLGLDAGDEVLAPAYTHLSTVLPMLHVNLIPVLCDVSEETGNLDPQDAERRISPRTRAIVVTHQYGHVCEMEKILDLARRKNLLVMEDCSHAHGATYKSRPAGTFGDVACFSLQAHKTVVAGEGGLLVTKNRRIFERAALLGHFRERTGATSENLDPFVETGYGLKNRLHPLGAAIALVQLNKMPEIVARRRENLEYFSERLRAVPGVRPLPTNAEASRGGYFRYLVKYIPDEMHGLPIQKYLETLRSEGVREVMPGSNAKPLHFTKIFQTLDDGMYRNGWPRRGPHVLRELVYKEGDFPRAERFSALTLQFPAFTEPSKRIIDAYCAAMQKVAKYALDIVNNMQKQ